MTKCIIYVPGKNLKPDPKVHHVHLWRCLVAGVARVAPQWAGQLERNAECFHVAGWNHFFYGEHASLDREIPWIDHLLQNCEATDEERAEAGAWHKVATKVMYTLGDHFHGLIKWIPDPRVKAMIADTTPYFENHDKIADRVRGVVKEQIVGAMERNEEVLLIGHSLGSVVAYEALWQLTHEDEYPHQVDLFLSLGSPLGMRYVQNHLLGWPGRTYPQGIVDWKNVSAVGDLISVDETVRDDFAAMIGHGLLTQIQDYWGGVYNWYRNDDGLNVHRSYGYLVNPQVGQIVADWWSGDGRDRAPVIVAHRGYPAEYPDNTLLGYERALATGVRFVELDVQFSKDRVPVVYHDPDTWRMSGVRGSLLCLTMADIRRLDAHFPERFGNRYVGTPIPTLSEFCEFMQRWPQTQVFVEIKSHGIDYFGIGVTVDRVIDAISLIAERCVIISFHDAALEYARSKHDMRIGWVLPDWERATERRAYALAPEFLFASTGRLPKSPGRIWRGPWQWAVYVVDDARQANRYAALGVRLVETDEVCALMADPALLRSSPDATSK